MLPPYIRETLIDWFRVGWAGEMDETEGMLSVSQKTQSSRFTILDVVYFVLDGFFSILDGFFYCPGLFFQRFFRPFSQNPKTK